VGSPTVSDGFVRNVGLTYRISYLIRHPLNGLQGYVDDPITEAEDVTQKIFFEFYRALQAFDPFISGIRTFLHSIANKQVETLSVTDSYRIRLSKGNLIRLTRKISF
jgi:hypothetical protein